MVKTARTGLAKPARTEPEKCLFIFNKDVRSRRKPLIQTSFQLSRRLSVLPSLRCPTSVARALRFGQRGTLSCGKILIRSLKKVAGDEGLDVHRSTCASNKDYRLNLHTPLSPRRVIVGYEDQVDNLCGRHKCIGACQDLQ